MYKKHKSDYMVMNIAQIQYKKQIKSDTEHNDITNKIEFLSYLWSA